jgi:putative chitinase
MRTFQLLSIAPAIGAARADLFIGPLNAAMARFEINNPKRQAHFLAQGLHESTLLTRMVENLDYAADRLCVIWPKRFTHETAQLYGRTAAHPANQAMIANVAYANRMGNSSVESGDGYRYRGRGIGQLTGRENYRACGAGINLDLVRFPEQVAQPEVACLSFAWFWHVHGLNALADADDVTGITRAVNGTALLGLDERAELARIGMQTLNCGVPV